MKRHRALSLLVLLATPACLDSESRAPPQRVRLFDLMDRATLDTPPARGAEPAAETVAAVDFDAGLPRRIWLVINESAAEYVDAAKEGTPVGNGTGVTGAGLSVGPLSGGAAGAAVVLFPAQGFARYDITGRTRLDRNSESGSASTREALRVIEHRGDVSDPGSVPAWLRKEAPNHRVSRRIDPSGWDRFSLTFVTRANTGALELQLRHQDDGSGGSVTRFDDVTVHCTPLVEADFWDHLRGIYAPKDGQEASTPWRIRAALPRALAQEEEVRDAVLLPPPSKLSFPVNLPPRETKARLRFHYGMLPDAFDAPGDGARIVVAFRPDDGDATEIGAVDFDPKQNKEDRSWQSVELDLTALGGRSGVLSFESRDVEGSEPDPLDAVILGTPRIEPTTETPSALNVLLIGVDTLRADRLSALGYGRPTTPHLERLADQGIRFPKVRVQAPWTLPSFSSILTSLYPSAHGAGRGGHQEWTGVDPGTTSLAEILSRVGYETMGIVANGLLSPMYGLDQGFEGYRSKWSQESAQHDVGSVCEFIDSHRTTPWHVFWHIMDPHLPYTTEASFREAFTDPDYVGQFSARNSVPYDVFTPPTGRRWYAHEGPPPAPDLSGADRRYVSDFYDAEIAETDAAIGRVFDALIASGQWERTIVAFIADHGEGLGDHDHYHHGYTLYDDQVHVPMLLRIPGRDEGRVVNTSVAAIDLAPTLLGALGIEPPDDFHGHNLIAGDFEEEQSYFIESPTYDSSAQKAWVEGDFKYLHDPVFRTEALFDLARDPGETTDVAARHPELVQRARAELARFRWEKLQRGRFHLRVAGRPGQRLTIAIQTDDVFDANFTTRPSVPEGDVQMDLDRKNFVLDTPLDDSRLELVFWCRGQRITLDVRLDGRPLEGGVLLGDADRARPLPLALGRDEIPAIDKDGVPTPKTGQALLWLDAGAAPRLPALPSPEEIEVLRQLGYAR